MHDRARFFWKNSLWTDMGIDGQKLPKNGVVIAEKALNQPINHTDSLIRYIALDGIS